MIVAEKLEGDIGTTLEISDVLLLGTRDSTIVGRPTVPGATVKLFVEEQTRDKKVRLWSDHRRVSPVGLEVCETLFIFRAAPETRG